jgi:hypothetical protein
MTIVERRVIRLGSLAPHFAQEPAYAGEEIWNQETQNPPPSLGMTI